MKSSLGYGYGSEFQLLRFMGRHREELNEILSKQLGISNNIYWLDFNYSQDNKSKDRELIGFQFLKSSVINDLKVSEFWPDKGPNWDAVAVDGTTYLLIEAKAHIKELSHKNMTGAKNKSYDLIRRSIHSLQKKYKIPIDDLWLTDYYQLANRLAFCDFLNEKGVSSRLVYICFLNGYEYSYSGHKIINKSVKNKVEWQKALNEMIEKMNIKGTPLEDLIEPVYIDCKPRY